MLLFVVILCVVFVFLICRIVGSDMLFFVVVILVRIEIVIFGGVWLLM